MTSRLHLTGLRLESMLSAPLFRAEYGCGRSREAFSSAYHAAWTDFADALAAAPHLLEIVLVLATDSKRNADARGACSFSILVAGRGDDDEAAVAASRNAVQAVEVLARTILCFARFRQLAVDEVEDLERLVASSRMLEVRRRRETFGVLAQAEGAPLGFLAPDGESHNSAAEKVSHLFPWIPSDDSWARLASVLGAEPGPAALIVHAQGHAMAPASAIAEVHAGVSAIETAERHLIAGGAQPFLVGQLGALKELGNRRLASMYHRVLAIRTYLATPDEPSPALLSTLSGSIDDPSFARDVPHADSPFRGGLELSTVDVSSLFSSAPQPHADQLFGPKEATAVFRGPMPTDHEIQGITLLHSRTLVFDGASGRDIALGRNVQLNRSVEVRLSEELRFRHTYVIGQTGTGKSTLLMNMALEDAGLGRGLCVIDPHGSLVDDILARLPRDRHEDVILLDLTDYENPVGFNPLYILEEDPDRYSVARDLVVDGILSYLLKTYGDVPEAFGPVFETHFRMMTGLLLGSSRPEPPTIPNLLLMRRLYANRKLRKAMLERTAEGDLGLQDAILEAQRTTDEASWDNIAPYITSKFTRFVADSTLRNVICQPRTLDFDRIVGDRKILLVNLGRGRIGDFPAGLLAGRVLAGIQQAVVRRGTGADNPGFYFYADEFQIFADSRFADLLAEARKYRLSLTLAHQHLDQLPADIRSAVHGNCGTTITFRVGAVDAGLLAEQRFRPQLEGFDLAGLPNFLAYVQSSGVLGMRPFSVRTFPGPAVIKPGQAEEIRRASGARWGRPIREVEREIRETMAAFEALGDGGRRDDAQATS